jgi:hypothetical protein
MNLESEKITMLVLWLRILVAASRRTLRESSDKANKMWVIFLVESISNIEDLLQSAIIVAL